MKLYRVSSVLLAFTFLGHTFGGMLGALRASRSADIEADQVFERMRSVHFSWNGADCTWFAFWLGNGLGVSALLLLGVAALWTLGRMSPSQLRQARLLSWTAFASIALVSLLGFTYFAPMIGAGFGVIALLVAIANFRSEFGRITERN